MNGFEVRPEISRDEEKAPVRSASSIPIKCNPFSPAMLIVSVAIQDACRSDSFFRRPWTYRDPEYFTSEMGRVGGGGCAPTLVSYVLTCFLVSEQLMSREAANSAILSKHMHLYHLFAATHGHFPGTPDIVLIGQ